MSVAALQANQGPRVEDNKANYQQNECTLSERDRNNDRCKAQFLTPEIKTFCAKDEKRSGY
jgi:hypothetical protein